jgi:chitodextrinase
MGEDVIVAALQNDGIPYTGNNEHTLGNLNAATEYYVIVTAKNAGDEWAPATIEAFTTLDSDPEPQIAEVTITVEVLGATSVKSTATPNEFAVGYIYSIYNKAEVEASSIDVIAGQLQAEGISYTDVDIRTWENLEPETEYYFIGTAQNAAGEWGPAASVSFKTDEDGLVELNSMVSIYPNPASSVIYVKYDSNAQVSLIDMTGRCVKATEISGDATINVEDLEKGMYIIKIQDGDNTMINRVVVK